MAEKVIELRKTQQEEQQAPVAATEAKPARSRSRLRMILRRTRSITSSPLRNTGGVPCLCKR